MNSQTQEKNVTLINSEEDLDLLQGRIEFQRFQLYKNLSDFPNTKSFINSSDKSDFNNTNPTVSITCDLSDINDRKFAEYLLSSLAELVVKYIVENNLQAFIGHEMSEKTWLSIDAQASQVDSMNEVERLLNQFKPSKVIYCDLMPYMNIDSVFGFGLYLFDEANNLIAKLVYKFFDESIAPENARKLNTPTTFEQLDDRSRPFF